MSKKKKAIASPSPVHSRSPRAGLLPRLGAWLVDALLAGGVLLLAFGAGLLLAHLLVTLKLVSLPVSGNVMELLAESLTFTLYLALALCSYFLWFWCRTGQTPGLRLLKLRVQNRDGSPLSLTQGVIRLFTAAFGLGNLLVLFDRQRLAFQDHWAHCEVVSTRRP